MILPEQFAPGSTAAAQGPVSTDNGAQPKARPVVTTANKEVSSTAANVIPPIGSAERSVTFRQEPSGRVYYVVSDATSGREIQEVPTETVRKVGESIDEYLKHEEAKATPHVDVKA